MPRYEIQPGKALASKIADKSRYREDFHETSVAQMPSTEIGRDN